MTASFDRVRPRTPQIKSDTGAIPHDAEGKRALFSSTGSADRPGMGSVLVECSRCDQRTVLGPAQAIRVAWPSLHLALRIGRGEDVSVVGLTTRKYPTYLRCPACGRPSWVRYTIQI
jgi:hypothetical protein